LSQSGEISPEKIHWSVKYLVDCQCFFFDVRGFYSLTTIGVTHLEVNGIFLDNVEIHDAICENNYVLNFIAKPLRGPKRLLHYYSTLITLGGLGKSHPC
jgi:hypothetical protein